MANLFNFLKRLPDQIIGEPENPYLLRWFIIPRNRFLNIYLHNFWKSDDDRALHDHPWINVSIPLKGIFSEVLSDGSINIRKPGKFYLRSATEPHRLLLADNMLSKVWSLFITGPYQRTWGFHCPKGWVHWKDFVSVYQGGNKIGKGCD